MGSAYRVSFHNRHSREGNRDYNWDSGTMIPKQRFIFAIPLNCEVHRWRESSGALLFLRLGPCYWDMAFFELTRCVCWFLCW
jgi:hypothetical protein